MLTAISEVVVAESVVVLKKLLQSNPEGHKDVIILMAKMTSSITVPTAKASILWLIGVSVGIVLIDTSSSTVIKHDVWMIKVIWAFFNKNNYISNPLSHVFIPM